MSVQSVCGSLLPVTAPNNRRRVEAERLCVQGGGLGLGAVCFKRSTTDTATPSPPRCIQVTTTVMPSETVGGLGLGFTDSFLPQTVTDWGNLHNYTETH